MSELAELLGYGDKVTRLKREARRHYETYCAEFDTMDCGKAMCEMMNSRMRDAKIAFNKAMDELAKIDPNCPTERL